VTELAFALWAEAPSLRDADVARLVARLIPAVQAGQIQLANLTNAYIAGLAAAEGVQIASARVDRDAILGYRGVPAAEVYRRPVTTVYTKLAAGQPFEVAKKAGLARLGSILSSDLQQSRTRQARAALSRSGYSGFRRVLTGKEDCALCVIASTQRYHRGDLMPIHPGCDCGVEPFTQPRNDQVIDQALLDQTHAVIDQKLGGTDYQARDLGLGKTSSKGQPLSDFTDLIVTREHGELGPTLTWRTDQFTSAADLGL